VKAGKERKRKEKKLEIGNENEKLNYG